MSNDSSADVIKHDTSEAAPPRSTAKLHFVIGWSALLFFMTLGIVLEALHGFKIGWLLDVDNETRRFMLVLAHAHGTLFSLIHILFAVTCLQLPNWRKRSRALASCCLSGGLVLVPLGFLGGGLIFDEGDPGLPVYLVPVGALLMLIAIALTAIAAKDMSVDRVSNN